MTRFAVAALATACSAQPAPPATATVTLPLALPPPPATTAPAPRAPSPPLDAADFTSERGAVHLAAEPGGAVAGSFEKDGVLTCNDGNKSLICHWYQGNEYGRASFHRGEGGRLEGTWGHGASDSDAGAWTLVPVPLPRAGDGLAGTWATNWGSATIHETSRSVHVDYATGTMDCARQSPEKLTCVWTEGSSTGAAELAIESPNVLRGTWGNGASAIDGGKWVFVRR